MKRSSGSLFSVVLLSLLVGGCASLSTPEAPLDGIGKAAELTEPDAPGQATAQADKTPPAAQDQATYSVQRGDTLAAIGRRYGVSVLQLQYRNQILDPRRLKSGSDLAIPDKALEVSAEFLSQLRPLTWPLSSVDVSDEFGTRHKRHKGIDLRAPRGTPILAAADGVVQFVGKQRGYGKLVILEHGDNLQTRYAHNDQNLVTDGQQVKRGEKIATVGRTGNSTGHHVHFEVVKDGREQNPRRYLLDG